MAASTSNIEWVDDSYDTVVETYPIALNDSQSTLTSSRRPHPNHCPPLYDSEYRWCQAEVKGRTVWYRNIDGMANFILHWQHRFHNHGDIYAHAVLEQRDRQGLSTPLDISVANFREALRRMRMVHPYTAVDGRSKSDLNAEKTQLPNTLEHLSNLQIVLAYTVPQSDKDVEEWLDEVVQVHSKEESREFADFYRKVSKVERGSTFSLRFHLWEADLDKGLPARVVIEQSHVLSDGGGLITTMDELITFIALTLAKPSRAAIEWGAEVKRLPPSLQDAIANPPTSWHVTRRELKQIERDSRARMSGKATPPNIVDKVADRIMEVTLANHTSNSKIRRRLNRPLASLVRKVAETGAMFPLGLLPNAKMPYRGPWTHSDFLEDTMSKGDTTKLLAKLKRHGVTLAPFMEAAMAFATTWVRRQRGLTPKKQAWDPATKVIGSFSNAVNKRDQLIASHQRYLGLAMAGIVTKISAGTATWSKQSLESAVPSPLDDRDFIPANIDKQDFASIVNVAKALGRQYQEGRADANWLKYDKVTMFSAMQAEYMCLSNEAYYPSHPWLSSPGRLDNLVSPSRPIGVKDIALPFSSSQFECGKPGSYALSGNSSTPTLVVSNLRIIGRTNLAQPICHLYSFKGEMTTTVSFPEWLYQSNDNGRNQKRHGIDYSDRASIVPLWYSIVQLIVKSFVQDQQTISDV